MDVTVFVWMFVILKIPIIAALLLIWWAVKAPEPTPDADQGGGGSDRHRGSRGRGPRPPRRGPHAEPPPVPPRRVRTAVGRKLTRHSH